jgi:hypothetical protein
MDIDEKQIYSIAPPAEWIKQNEFDLAGASRHAASPFFYLLVDYQDHVRDGEIQRYCRSVEKINDSSRIEDSSLYLKDLHEENERVIFHGLDIIRDGQRISALNPDNITTYRREKSLERHITDNLLTVSLSVDDLRVGDLVEFHTTTLEYASEHPLWGKYYRARFWLDWSCPVVRQNIRISNRSGESLNLHHHFNEDGKQSENYEELKPEVEFERQYTNLVPKSIHSTAPDWVWTDFLQVVSKISWQRISQYLFAYYTEVGALGGDLDASDIDRLRLIGDKCKDALQIIRFVQNEIRYRGENHGAYTHTPKLPQYALEKGAGDCKDKSNLLVALLKSIGVDANLVLVNTDHGKAIHRFKPSPYYFNHMIVRVCVDSHQYYIDPTIQKQAGDFEHAAQLNYGYGLNLTAPGEDLTRIPYDFSKKVFELKHVFDFRDTGKGNGNLTITRKFRAHRADNMRYGFDSNEVQNIQQDYLQWARDDTDLDLSTIQAISILEDDKNENILTTEERYNISNMDKTQADKFVYVTTDFCQDFPIPEDKKFPVLITADGAMEHSLEVRFQVKPNVDATEEGISNRHFTYLDKVWLEGKVLKFNTLITPYREVVEQSDIGQYQSDVEEMRGRSVSVFPYETGVEISLGWQQTLIAALLLAALMAALLGT